MRTATNRFSRLSRRLASGLLLGLLIGLFGCDSSQDAPSHSAARPMSLSGTGR